MKLTSVQLGSITRLFSSAVFKEMAEMGRSPMASRLISEAQIGELLNAPKVGDAFDFAFCLLSASGRRDEYIYKSAIAHKILLGRHSLNTASMLTEFRIDNRVADVVILNGSSTVYEIKSERDSLHRLEKQVNTYRQVFAKVCVLSAETHVEEVIKATPYEVGVVMLSNRNSLSVIRPAIECPELIVPDTLFESLRTTEALQVVESFGIECPNVPNTKMRSTLREIFIALEPEKLHSAMVKTLKQTRGLKQLSGLLNNLPMSLKPAALSMPLKKASHDNLISAINTPLHLALKWK